ncbi:GatB/YqeY domain-containing protein [Pararhizobium sp. BT-229]|uniref:GatB/YqeY domain-containing protein n=1 Tax=Pararhizobium sp. BT-229 TaxID=2986923 RepID=UPI0021F6AE95|nr:GatB/YqeY domain-containing protein [Pararhizobium sp. BT-229]MCV9964645.1 GatB/YqeY domain-containing protein [Pararhizobium sp. BT-229]
MTTEAAETSLHDRIKTDIDTAFRAGDKATTGSLKSLLGDAVRDARKKEVRLPTDIEIIALLRKFVANAQVRAASYEKNGRTAEAGKERAEITLLSTYLPPEISADDVRAFLEGLKASGTIPAGPKGLGDAVKALKEKYGNSFDGNTMTPIAKEVVSG